MENIKEIIYDYYEKGFKRSNLIVAKLESEYGITMNNIEVYQILSERIPTEPKKERKCDRDIYELVELGIPKKRIAELYCDEKGRNLNESDVSKIWEQQKQIQEKTEEISDDELRNLFRKSEEQIRKELKNRGIEDEDSIQRIFRRIRVMKLKNTIFIKKTR